MIKSISFNKRYRILTNSEYFKKKYGVNNPIITELNKDEEVFGDKWTNRLYVPAVISFLLRQKDDNIYNKKGIAYYGKIENDNIEFGLKELVFINELELIK
jgi:hypothetical protein|tara:strand:+ start:941 stop:1243 length:303 start_codon:yes stop_codon:yes gene_type:complete